MYKAFEHATTTNPDSVIILTDLLTNKEALLMSASRHERANIIGAQIGATWPLCGNLEDAYAAHDKNNRLLKRLRRLGLAVLDVRPERLTEDMSKRTLAPAARLL